ncbi:two-component system sensor histidine kinase NtrB [Paenibacillus endoradicis]|uniref:two-component system sensor histidine kinase NtrB n=1 Tax=Paenibacillus endoradicis TaxID=2972487 RepID=UPI002159338B|nr:ATP-binding protein [Paenibacillus endoradicis]MCR8659551.1 ATP-binding protein [Paenibacillus endoradicis]
MFYPIILYATISALPAAYMYFYPTNVKSQTSRKLIVSAISLFSFILQTHYILDMNNYQYSFALIPLFFAGLYAGRCYLAMVAVCAVLFHILYFTTAQEFLLFTTYVFIVSIVNFTIYSKYQTLHSARKIILVLCSITVTTIVCVFLFLQSTGTEISGNNTLLWWEEIGYGIIFYCTILYSFMLLIRQENKDNLINLYQSMSYSTEYELNTWIQVIRNAPIAIINVNVNGEIMYANNKAYEKHTNLRRVSNKIGYIQKLDDVLSSPVNSSITQLVKQVFMNKLATNTTQFDGQNCYMFSAVPIISQENEQIVAVSLFVQDITELHVLRHELDHMDRLSLVGQMAASITHEIRNPMAVIRGFVQLLEEKSGSKGHEYYRIIIDELDRANAIISDFLALAQQREVKKELQQINKVIDDLYPLLLADANLRGQTMEFTLADQLPSISINEREIKQLMLNLSRNAMEAMDQDGHLHISTRICNEGILLSVSDQGPGIADDMKIKIFEPFVSTKTTGTGLGLPLCADIAKRHNAHIEVLNNIDRGSIFQILFPIEKQMETQLLSS